MDARASYRQKVCAFSRTIGLVPSYMLRVRWTPSSCVISSHWVLDLNDLGTSINPHVSKGTLINNLSKGLRMQHTEDYSLPKVSKNLRAVWLESCQLMFSR